MKGKPIKSFNEMVGEVLYSDKYGNIKITAFEEHELWAGKVNIYLDRFSVYTCVGSFRNSGGLPGGGLLVEKTTDAVTIPDNTP